MMNLASQEIGSGYTEPTWYSEASEEEQETFRDWLRSLLRTETVHLTFQKKDGTIREMNCTLSESKLPKQEQGKEARKANDSSMPVFDLDKNEWRAFRFDSVKHICFTLGK
jgi:hypothetical protein